MAAEGARVSALAVYRSALQQRERPSLPAPGVFVSLKRRGKKRRPVIKQEATGVTPGAVRGEQQGDPRSLPKAVSREQPADPRPVPGIARGKRDGVTDASPAAREKLAKKRRVSLKANCTASPETREMTRPKKRNRGRTNEQPDVVAAAAAPSPPLSSPSIGDSQALFPRCPSSSSSLRRLLRDLGSIQHSRQRAAKLFEWLLSPISPQCFFDQYWEKKPLLIHRHNPNYYQGFFSTAEFDAILRDNDVQFGVNLDVTSYADGKRETHNPVGRALPAVVWDFYKHGCSLRLLNPQAFSSTVWQFLAILQEHFGSMAGANTYLTPPGTQGFAPHYDDIEAFVIQLEGKKHWRVYSPRREAEVLPQFSSNNFSQTEIGEPIIETILETGDLLYFPRGFIHQGDCLPDAHSLHITVSSYQRNSWADLLEKLLPAALQIAVEEDVEYRQGLPIDYLEYMGVLNSDHVDPRRAAFIQKINTLITKLVDYAPVDAAVDQKTKAFLHDCLPPVLNESEKALSVYGHPARWENGNIQNVDVQIKGKTQVRLLRYGIIRLCNEGDSLLLYYTTENSRVYHKEEPKYCEIEPEYADGIEFLLSSYPNFISVKALPCATLDDKIALATVLFEKGLLITKKPLSSL
ncbi:ribosomal oxygenase 1 [Pogona vitticeps]